MKAKFVYEAMDFERGQDPKSSIGIGHAAVRNFDSLKDLLEWTFKHPEVISQGRFKEWDYDINRTETDYGPMLYPKQLHNYKIATIKWIKDNIKYKGEKIGLRDAKDTIDNLEKLIIKKADKISESLDFERGKDPKEAIGVGIVAKIMNGIKELKKLGYGPFSTFYDDEGAKDLNLEIHFGSISGGPSEKEMRKTVESYFPDMLEYEMARVWKLFFRIKRKYAFYFEEALYNLEVLKESLEFERGQDPKSSLGIGKKIYDPYFVENILDDLNKKTLKSMKKIFEEKEIYYLGDSNYHDQYISHFNRIYNLVINKDPFAEDIIETRTYEGRNGEFEEYDVIAVWDTPIGKIGCISEEERNLGDTWFGDLEAAINLRIDQLNIL